jgi:hypothetical protein
MKSNFIGNKFNEEGCELEECKKRLKEELTEKITKVPPKLQGEVVEPTV